MAIKQTHPLHDLASAAASPRLLMSRPMLPSPRTVADTSNPRLLFLGFGRSQRALLRRVGSSRGAAHTSVKSLAADNMVEALDDVKSLAVVIGGSIAGLLAAAAVAPYFDEVVILEKDKPLAEVDTRSEMYADGRDYLRDGRARRGVPQFLQVHGILVKGWQLVESYLPGVEQALIDAGAVPFDSATDVKECTLGVVRYDPQSTLRGEFPNYLATRPVIERVMRERLLSAHGNISIRWDTRATHLLHSREGKRGFVTGVEVLSGGAQVRGDLIIDASGPGSAAHQWLKEGGYATPHIVKVDPFVGYTFSILDVPQKVHDNIKWKVCYVRPQAPETRGCLVIRIEQGRFQVGSIGYGGDYPPLHYEGFVDFMDSLGQDDISEIVHSGVCILSQGFRGAHNKRHYYEDVALPENLVIVGDAVAHFNPAYGQGITTAALQVDALSAVLKEQASGQAGSPKFTNLSSILQPRIGKVLDFPFSLAIGEDLKYITTISSEPFPPSLSKDLFGAYFKQIFAASAHDDAVKLAYMRVFSMMDGAEALLAPRIVLGVLASMLRRLPAQLLLRLSTLSPGAAKEVADAKLVKPLGAGAAVEDS